MTKRSKGVGSGTGAVASTAHTTQPQYTGDEIALGITFQLAIGERRTIVVQTHTTRDAPSEELNALMDKVNAALDRQNSRYRVKELYLNRKLQHDQMALVMENNALTREKWEREWTESKRKGVFQLSANQHNTHQQQLQMIERHKKEIAAIDTEIRDLEAQIKG